MASEAPKINVCRMPQQAGVSKAQDDWTGIIDTKERRRRQNRLNVRAYRRRKALKDTEHGCTSLDDPIRITTVSIRTKPQRQALLADTSQINSDTITSTETASPIILFPLSPDHQLLFLIEENVSRAILTNYYMYTLARSRFPASFTCIPMILPPPPPQHAYENPTSPIPPSLEPTEIQLTVPHPAWIDLFPMPQLRDNIILAFNEGTIDTDELCDDLVGPIFDEFCCVPSNDPAATATSQTNRLGLIAWSEPWDIGGWELTEECLKKWSFLLYGCETILQRTNGWRATRGEDPVLIST